MIAVSQPATSGRSGCLRISACAASATLLAGLLVMHSSNSTAVELSRLHAETNRPTPIRLSDGTLMPPIAAGTGGYYTTEGFYDDRTAERAVGRALDVGFTSVDTAVMYGNEAGVGNAVRRRSGIFVTSKVSRCAAGATPDECAATTVAQMRDSTVQLGLPQHDLVLVHQPPAGVPCAGGVGCTLLQAQWRAMEAAQRVGLTRSIGVSNLCPACLRCLLRNATVPPAVNQVEIHVGMGADPGGIATYSMARGVIPYAYSPLSSQPSRMAAVPAVAAAAAAHGRSAVQVALRWVVQHGWPLVVKSQSVEHLRENLDVFGWGLSEAEMRSLDNVTLGPGGRLSC